MADPVLLLEAAEREAATLRDQLAAVRQELAQVKAAIRTALHTAIDHEVIRAVAALRQEQTVVREQGCAAIFLSGTAAARLYLLEILDRTLETIE